MAENTYGKRVGALQRFLNRSSEPQQDPQKFQDKQNLLEILSSGDTKTFDQCLQQFNNKFQRSQWFKICQSICYLLEGNLLTKSQRIVSFYILYKVYNNENFKVTPFESIVLSSINRCQQVMHSLPESFEALEIRAEYKLLTDFVISTPKIGSKNVNEYIWNIEKNLQAPTIQTLSQAQAPNAPQSSNNSTQQQPGQQNGQTVEAGDLNNVLLPTLIQQADIKEHIKNHLQQMPHVSGPKAFAVAAPVLKDEADIPDNQNFGVTTSQIAGASSSLSTAKAGQNQYMMSSYPNIFPQRTISAQDLTDEELLPHFFTPDFLRPTPQLEGEDLIDEEDFEDGYWMVPGLCPEPYWDLNTGKELSHSQALALYQKAVTTPLSAHESEFLLRHLRRDSEVLMHLGVLPSNVEDLIQNNHQVASQVLVSMVTSVQFSDFLESLLEMKTSSNQLEVFSVLNKLVCLPQEYVHLFYVRLMEYCMSMETREREKMNMARIACVFFVDQLESKVCQMNDQLHHMILKFCLEFEKVQEADNLKKLILRENYMSQQEKQGKAFKN